MQTVQVVKYVNVSQSIPVLTESAPLIYAVMLQKIILQLSMICDGNPLMMALVASAVVKVASDDDTLVTDGS